MTVTEGDYTSIAARLDELAAPVNHYWIVGWANTRDREVDREGWHP